MLKKLIILLWFIMFLHSKYVSSLSFSDFCLNSLIHCIMSGFDTRTNPDSSARDVGFVLGLVGSYSLIIKVKTPYKVVIPFFVYVSGPSK